MESGIGIKRREIQEIQTDKVESSGVYPLQEGTPDALVLHCSDHRFQEAFHDFIREELNIKMPAVIAIPGSVSSFGVQTFLPKGWHALRNQIELMTSHNKFSRVILINHEDCKGYAKIVQFLGGLSRIIGEQRRHLQLIGKFIKKEYLPNSQVELYQAKIVREDNSAHVQFEKII